MRIYIDAQRCQGHNVCLGFVPELLESDDAGFVSARGEGVVPEPQRQQAVLAYQSCPEQAIELREDS
ncbi:hypothetical protein BST14_18910 [Mycobacterium arosiense ATCC BAA-1401 = DSM 45069]|uniref:Ferredoxin n=1 Tax=Mycobacterium arosiense ATCC BAA-1401 = DSM 45069 TaxID=1265311 RepID=A0A1W9ZBM0_MYCAI|nr:hypothetical protein BST14_18910 [Mycobacterium arosiense ATCC BAA-1401 = DSM 45069]